MPRITPRLTALVLTLLCLSHGAAAQELENGIPCPGASSGAHDAYLTAVAYDKGTCGKTADDTQAQAWYLKAAQAGDADAQYQMGEHYFSNDDSKTDFATAKQWYLKAARQGHGLAQLRLGFIYAEAHYSGAKTDDKEAEKWFLAAAQQNAGDAQFRLGTFYHNYKQPPDLKKAEYWLTKAAEGGHRVAMYDLANMIRARDPKTSIDWLTKAADLDLLQAQMMLSTIYEKGDGVPADPAQSLKWAERISAAPTAAPYWLNRVADSFYNQGDFDSARTLYTRAARRGDPHARARLTEIEKRQAHDSQRPAQ